MANVTRLAEGSCPLGDEYLFIRESVGSSVVDTSSMKQHQPMDG